MRKSLMGALLGIVVGVAIAIIMTLVKGEETPANLAETAGLIEVEREAGNTNKVIWIGVDAACWKDLEPMLAAGELPNFNRLINDGYSCDLHAMRPTLSPRIWTTMSTGQTPSGHGILGFWLRDQGPVPVEDEEEIPYTSRNRLVPQVWHILGEQGLTTGDIAQWASWPAEGCNGYTVSERGATQRFNLSTNATKSKEGMTYPPSLVDEIAPMIRDPRDMTAEELARLTTMDHAEFLKIIDRLDRGEDVFFDKMVNLAIAYTSLLSYEEIHHYLYKKYEPDFAFVYFEAIDNVGHLFYRYAHPETWKGPDEITEADIRMFENVITEMYRIQDETLGRILDELDDDTYVILTSDHGMVPIFNPKKPLVSAGHNIKSPPDGIFAVYGPGVMELGYRPGANIEPEQITPTILWLMGFPIAQDMDGGVFERAFQPGWIIQHPITKIPSYDNVKTKQGPYRPAGLSPEEADEVMDPEFQKMLKALGYM